MKSRRLQMMLLLFAAVLLLTGSAFAGEAKQLPAADLQQYAHAEDFSCYTLDQNSRKIYGYANEADGTWYLFVPSGAEIEELDVYYTGDVIHASAGELNQGLQVVADPFASSGDAVELQYSDGTILTVAAMQSDLASVQIYMPNATLADVHMDKDEKFKKNTLVITDPEGKHSLTVRDSVELKGRGNTTWQLYEKKGYQLKFDDKTSILGMEKAKKWVLLANASDDSMLRNQLVYRMARHMDFSYVPQFEFVDLWINGEYRGTYLLGEKIEIGPARLDLDQRAAVLMEHDESFYMEEDYWFYNEMMQRHFVVKEFAEDDPDAIRWAMEDFDALLDSLMDYLYTTPPSQVTQQALSQWIDVDSFAKYFLVNEYVQNRESFATSFYWYKNGEDDVLHMGPIWDFDTCMGNDGAAPHENYGNQHVLFTYLLASPAFYNRTEELYLQYKNVFSSMETDAAGLAEKISASADMNYLRWNVLGTANSKAHAADFYATFEEAVAAVTEWLHQREINFTIPKPLVATSLVSEDCSTIDIFFEDAQPHTQVRFAIWNPQLGNDLTLWCLAEQSDGMWHATADLTKLNTSGVYRFDVYVDEVSSPLALGRGYVEKAASPKYPIEYQLSGSTLNLTVKDTDTCQAVSFAVWSEENGQSDIQWFDAAKNTQGNWDCSVDLSQFSNEDIFHIHAYGNKTGYEYEFINDTVVYYGPMAWIDADGTTLSMLIRPAEPCQAVSFAVWSEENNQSDLQWFTGARKNIDFWLCSVDLSLFQGTGPYLVHAYGDVPGQGNIFLEGTRVMPETNPNEY